MAPVKSNAPVSVINNAAAANSSDAPKSAGADTPRRMTILVCSTCRDAQGSDNRPRPGELLVDAVRAANCHDDITVESVECLGNCKRRLSAALVTPGCWSYVFGDLSVENATDLIEGAVLMRSSQDGLMPWRGRPQCLKKGMVSRIPPLTRAGLLDSSK